MRLNFSLKTLIFNESPSQKGLLSPVDHHRTTLNRKDDHLQLCLNEAVHSLSGAGFDRVILPHCALPEIDFNDVDLSTCFLKQNLRLPLIISSMTGGNPKGEALNLRLAQFAERQGIAMGVGSQRVALETRNPALFSLRKVAPRAVLFANLGAVQLNYGVSPEDCLWLTEQLQAQALILHLNPLQEAIQNEGDRNFSGLLKKIELVKSRLGSVPLILKETGCGLDAQTARRAVEIGVDALDVAGLGGTHWGFIEGLRTPERQALGHEFRNWGLETVSALIQLRSHVPPHMPLVASGGLRGGLDAAKAFYLGADMVAMALPFLKAAEEGEQALDELLKEFSEGLRTALFCTGSKTVKELQTQ